MPAFYALKYSTQKDYSFSIFRLIQMRDFYLKHFPEDSGVTVKFIGIEISRRIASFFLFLTFSLLVLAVSFRHRVIDFKMLYLLILPLVIFLFKVVQTSIHYVSDVLIIMFSSTFNLQALAILTILLHSIILIAVVVYNSSTKV